MNTPIEEKQNKTVVQTNDNQSEFNFELWIKQVRPQLLASIQKRGIK